MSPQAQHVSESVARQHNSPDLWDQIYQREAQKEWRSTALANVYKRIVHLIPTNARVVDLGGGIGALASQLSEKKNSSVTVWDHSPLALSLASSAGHKTKLQDLEDLSWHLSPEEYDVAVCTETLEHLSGPARMHLLDEVSKLDRAFISVPNNSLSPEHEKQHATVFTALQFKRTLANHFTRGHRVEVHHSGFWKIPREKNLEWMHVKPEEPAPEVRAAYQDAYLLGVCGYPKSFKLSLCLPIRDEEKYIGHTLASFYGAADEIVIGIDPRSKDNTRHVVSQYADLVFDLTELQGPPDKPDEQVPPEGIHFSHARNQCINRCTGDWIFMTEGHEFLKTGLDALLQLDRLVPAHARVCFVLRTGDGQQWSFPWLFRNAPDLRFARATHNVLDFPAGTFIVRLSQVATRHERDMDSDLARHKQRKYQNRLSLMEDWIINDNETSLFYLGSEWREYDYERATQRLEQYLALPPKNGPMRYQARLILAKSYARRGERQRAKDVLMGCVTDDWSRIEHWLWLGDTAFDAEEYQEALQYYRYAATCCGEPPFTLWWIDCFAYGYTPAQRLAMTYSALGRLPEALEWAKKVVELLPEDSPDEAREECERNIKTIEEAINARGETEHGTPR